jgi:hypothetical protein
MASDSAKEKLVHFLDQNAFEPVLKARPERFSDTQKRMLDDVQKRTRTEMERFHRYGSARDGVVNFKRDLDSEPAKKVHRELKRLGLPTVNDVERDFLKLAGELHIEG